MPVRLDYQMIESYVEPGSHVLDLGCGDGVLLEQLIQEKGCTGTGVDSDLQQVHSAIARGVPVYHGDMLEAMEMYGDDRFDCVILSQTLQQTAMPDRVVQEMLRVGRRGIISFPNFAHWRVRVQLLLGGKMPVTGVLPYSWYETPNIHLLTIKDFHEFCRRQGVRIMDAIYLSPGFGRRPALMANLLASMAIFVVERQSGAAKNSAVLPHPLPER
ncbi:MAG: methionine biosynthesis protein MetW [Candidatus Brocadiia bacterium]